MDDTGKKFSIWVRPALGGFGFGMTLILALWIYRGIQIEKRHYKSFEATQIGESMNMVLRRFGEPSDVSGFNRGDDHLRQAADCNPPCWMRLWYVSPFVGRVSSYSIDFDEHQNVVNKFYSSSP
ncbi:MAG: hypothetical protein K0Q91_910 [Fibrobacteria bacterium]|jgi:hypothetical protein|nr:hypothetical protein [Fibrobacteria bacterium]